MKIGFDAKKAVSNITGIGNYSRRCIDGIASIAPENEVVLFAPHKTNEKAVRELTARAQYIRPTNTGKLSFLWWRNFGMVRDIKAQKIDIFHGLSNELPFGIHKAGCKTIVTIHDLIFRLLPETFGWADRQILTAKTRYACNHADCIIAVSERTKRDIVRLYGIPEERIKVVYQSINDIFRHPIEKTELELVRGKYSLPEKFLLCVGTIEKRKNQLCLVKSLVYLPEEYHVVLVGRRTQYAEKIDDYIARNNLQDRVHFIKGIGNSELPALYQLARVFVLMSYYEGFGIPIAEAAASGVPVVAATGSCLEEAGGPGSIYLDPNDAKSVAETVMKINDSQALREKMIKRGIEYSALFKDDRQAEEMLGVYCSILNI